MIGFILGTTEGRELLAKVNEFTDNIVVSTATKYGGDLLNQYKMKYLNTNKLTKDGFLELVNTHDINLIVDASHPYAHNVSEILIEVCKVSNIKYIRYERLGILDLNEYEDNVVRISNYEEIMNVLKNIEGNILNTTGSNNIETIENLKLSNRIIHRILPLEQALEKVNGLGIKLENLIAIKGPFSKEMNSVIIKDYNIEAIITKDSGSEGGMREKLDAAIENNIKIIVIDKPKINYGIKFNYIDDVIKYIKKIRGN